MSNKEILSDSSRNLNDGRTSSGTTFAKMRGRDLQMLDVNDNEIHSDKLNDRSNHSGHISKRVWSSFTALSTRSIRKNVFSDNLQSKMAQDPYQALSEVKKVQKSDETKQFLKNVVKSYFLFDSLSSADVGLFVEAMIPETVDAGTKIIEQGDDADFFYIVEDGKVEFFVQDQSVGYGSRQKSFGELALLHNCPRTATCVAVTNCKLWKIDRDTFRYITMHSTEIDDKKIIDVLKTVPLFKNFEMDFFRKLANAMTSVSYKDNEVIIRKGDLGHTFYVIQKGRVAITEVGQQLNRKSTGSDILLGHGQTFGERALLTGEKRSATVVASGDCDLLCLEREDFDMILGPLNDLLNQTRWRHILVRQ